jgi:hypothetical protein
MQRRLTRLVIPGELFDDQCRMHSHYDVVGTEASAKCRTCRRSWLIATVSYRATCDLSRKMPPPAPKKLAGGANLRETGRLGKYLTMLYQTP